MKTSSSWWKRTVNPSQDWCLHAAPWGTRIKRSVFRLVSCRVTVQENPCCTVHYIVSLMYFFCALNEALICSEIGFDAWDETGLVSVICLAAEQAISWWIMLNHSLHTHQQASRAGSKGTSSKARLSSSVEDMWQCFFLPFYCTFQTTSFGCEAWCPAAGCSTQPHWALGIVQLGHGHMWQKCLFSLILSLYFTSLYFFIIVPLNI